MPIDLNAINEAILAGHARWSARENTLTGLDDADRRLRLGYTPGTGEPSLQEREEQGRANTPAARAAMQSSLPPAVDWRNFNGACYVSPVRDQGSCGSCVAFGTGATIDAAMRISRALPVYSPNGSMLADISEAQLFYCGAGQNCQIGWNVPPALAYATNTGLVPDYEYPYTPGNQNCSLPGGWQKYITTVSGSHFMNAVNDMKNALASRGPLTACFSVYDDFFSYSSGVYTHQSGGLAGGHCVTVIGYNDSLQAWLCKNSWGTSWGMSGYFWIEYGQCGIDAGMWAVDSFARIFPVLHQPGWLTMAHQGYGANGQLWYTETDGTGDYAPDLRVPDIGMSSGPALAAYRGQLYLAHQGFGANGQLWYSVLDGTWSIDQQVPNVGMSSGPSLAVFGDRLYCLHQGYGDNGQLWYTSFDGNSWSKDQQVPNVGMSESPALAVYNGRLYCLHQGYGDNGQLWYTSFDGNSWSGDQQVQNVGMSSGPGLAVFGGKLYCAHQGYGANGQLWYTSFDGNSWSGDQQVQNVGMSSGPGLTVFGGKLYCAHQGYGANGQLWYTSFDGNSWSGDQQVPNVGMSESPALVVW
jgi:C1A family cysteine protease